MRSELSPRIGFCISLYHRYHITDKVRSSPLARSLALKIAVHNSLAAVDYTDPIALSALEIATLVYLTNG